MSYPITTSLNVVKELQWVKEVTRGTTPAAPTFAAIPTQEFAPVPSIENIKYRKLGSPDLYKGIKVRELYDFSLTYAPVDSVLLGAMINLVGTNDRDDSFTFVLSQLHNNAGTLTEMYQIARGCSVDNVTINVESGEVVIVESEWIASTLSDWATTSGLTTPTFAPALTATPWSTVTTGTSPMVWNSLSYDVRNFSCTISQNPDRVQVIGQTSTTWVQATIREIEFEMDVVWKDTTLQADTKSHTPRTMTFQLNSTGPTILTFTEATLEEYEEPVSADSTDAKVITYTGYAKSVSIN
jgi:Phage tail tube protein